MNTYRTNLSAKFNNDVDVDICMNIITSYCKKYNYHKYDTSLFNICVQFYTFAKNNDINPSYVEFIYVYYDLIRIEYIMDIFDHMKNKESKYHFDINCIKESEADVNFNGINLKNMPTMKRVFLIGNSNLLTEDKIKSLDISPDDCVFVMNKFNLNFIKLYNTKLLYCATLYANLKRNINPRHIYDNLDLFQKLYIFNDMPGYFYATDKDNDKIIYLNYDKKKYGRQYYHMRTEFKIPSVGYSIFRYLMDNFNDYRIVLVGFYGNAEKGYGWDGHDFAYEQAVYKYMNVEMI